MEILKTLSELKNSLLDFVFPPHCLLCNRFISLDESEPNGYSPTGLVCQNCWKNLNIIPHPFCPACRILLERGMRSCPSCSDSSSLRLSRSLGFFDPYYQTLLHHFKYKRKISLGKELGKRLGELLKQDEFSKDYDYLIPVPLHKARERERGYNQSEILAEEISKFTVLPVLNKVLCRKKNTRDQTNLNAEERERNVRGAFVVRDKRELNGKKVLLVDDVMTTGATLKECSRVLKEAGVKEVAGVTLVVVNI